MSAATGAESTVPMTPELRREIKERVTFILSTWVERAINPHPNDVDIRPDPSTLLSGAREQYGDAAVRDVLRELLGDIDRLCHDRNNPPS
jgi:hypothetical protein